jgi:osmotically-inducible protein OsmY
MRSAVTAIILASALAAVACTNTDTSPKQDRAAGSEMAVAPSGPVANRNPAPNEAAPTATNNAGGADRTKEVDNTGINERDRRGTLTPGDQGNSASETDITANIRKGIMADDQLSFVGKNVKVITVGSKVTLRGPVKTDQAKLAIADLATRTAGVSEVDNQLEVKN